jgi:hypothetical protein
MRIAEMLKLLSRIHMTPIPKIMIESEAPIRMKLFFAAAELLSSPDLISLYSVSPSTPQNIRKSIKWSERATPADAPMVMRKLE